MLLPSRTGTVTGRRSGRWSRSTWPVRRCAQYHVEDGGADVLGRVRRPERGDLRSIFGTLVEFSPNNSTNPGDYLIGEKIVRSGFGKAALRFMDQPSKDGNSANCWSSSVGNLDVHYSSGVANHFAYLLAEGSGAKTINGVSYDSPTCNNSTVTGIGRDKLGAIWYRALTVYMTSSTNYAGARRRR